MISAGRLANEGTDSSPASSEEEEDDEQSTLL